jgi:hypothetical protein
MPASPEREAASDAALVETNARLSHRSSLGTAGPIERQTSWVRSFGLAAVILLVSYLAFVLIPNNLLAYLSTRTVPFTRDLLVTLWGTVGFIACGWLFVRLQRSRER